MKSMFAAVVLLSMMCAVSVAAQVPVLVDDTGHEAGPAYPASPQRFTVLIPVNGIRYWTTVVDFIGMGRFPGKADGEWDLALPSFSALDCTGNVFLSLSNDARGNLGAPRLWVAPDGRAYTHIEPQRRIAIASYMTFDGQCVNQSFIMSGYKTTFIADLDLIYPLPLSVELP